MVDAVAVGHILPPVLQLCSASILPVRRWCLFVFLALQPIVVVFSQPSSGL